jgi:hypothetical protein
VCFGQAPATSGPGTGHSAYAHQTVEYWSITGAAVAVHGENVMSQHSPTLAPRSYRAYFDHLLACQKCSAPPRRCDEGSALYRTYRSDLKKS